VQARQGTLDVALLAGDPALAGLGFHGARPWSASAMVVGSLMAVALPTFVVRRRHHETDAAGTERSLQPLLAAAGVGGWNDSSVLM